MTDTMISVQNLTKVYPLYNRHIDRFKEALDPRRKKYHHDFYALSDISFEVKKGEAVGIIGRNGSGKSTLLKILSGVLTPSSGTYSVNGRVSSLLELGTGFNPELTGIENIYFNGTLLGLSRKEIEEKLDNIIAFADIGDFIEQPVKIYSSGMYLRLAFSVAISVEPDILVIDEALAVGDALFQKKCFMALNKLKSKNTTILFVSHDIGTVKVFTDKALLLNFGNVIDYGPSLDICLKYNQLLFGNDANVPDTTTKAPADIVSIIPKQATQRYGTGCAELQRIELIGLTPQRTIRGGEAITINCYCKWDAQKIAESIKNKMLFDNINVGLLFQNVKHVNIFGVNSLQKNVIINPQLQHEACVSFILTIPYLASGDYFISPAIAVGDQENFEILAWFDDLIHLKCESTKKYIFGIFDVEAKIYVK